MIHKNWLHNGVAFHSKVNGNFWDISCIVFRTSCIKWIIESALLTSQSVGNGISIFCVLYFIFGESINNALNSLIIEQSQHSSYSFSQLISHSNLTLQSVWYETCRYTFSTKVNGQQVARVMRQSERKYYNSLVAFNTYLLWLYSITQAILCYSPSQLPVFEWKKWKMFTLYSIAQSLAMRAIVLTSQPTWVGGWS